MLSESCQNIFMKKATHSNPGLMPRPLGSLLRRFILYINFSRGCQQQVPSINLRHSLIFRIYTQQQRFGVFLDSVLSKAIPKKYFDK
jgi:hypothetical protein